MSDDFEVALAKEKDAAEEMAIDRGHVPSFGEAIYLSPRQCAEMFEEGARFAREYTLTKDPLVLALVEALNFRKHHDDDCEDSTEKFEPTEMCECGASVAKQALAAFAKELEKLK